MENKLEKINNVVINKVDSEGRVKAYVTFVINNEFAVHDARIIEGNNGLFVAMPSRKTTNGFKDVCHPITQELRQEIDQIILKEYNK